MQSTTRQDLRASIRGDGRMGEEGEETRGKFWRDSGPNRSVGIASTSSGDGKLCSTSFLPPHFFSRRMNRVRY